MFRYYAFDIQRDLFGQWTLVRRWGRIGTQGRHRIESFPTRDLASRARDAWRSKKVTRGYCERS